MSMQEAMEQRFKDEAVRLMTEIGVRGVTAQSLLSDRGHRAQFRAMLVDACRRLEKDTVNWAAVDGLIWQCDVLDEREKPDAPDGPPGRFAAGGAGYQVPRIASPETLKPVAGYVKDMKGPDDGKA